ncbi:hypothetical protein [Pseudomonas sp. D(2018)]|uniref:hypothetical protein n=1 Tax=Pseudomonas sp. D(2018) TaxID=2502238 RepID=UPI0010F8960F|nr:hypothetical protein [Pseudomonas sp. D(2018)]
MNRILTWLLGGITALIVTTAIAIYPWWKTFHDSPLSGDPADWGVFGDYIGGTLATVLAALSFLGLMISVIQQNQAMRKEWQLRDDENYAKQAVVCLERAFAKVNPPKENRIPIRNRLLWLECARTLLSADELADRIKSDGFKAFYASEREHWRGKFRDLFEPDGLFEDSQSPKYYRGLGEEQLDSDSVYVIYKFMTWQDDQPDILDMVEENWDLDKVSTRYVGARAYLNEFKKFHKH